MTKIDLVQKNFQGDREHLEVIIEAVQKQNIRIWNDWRADNLRILPDLKGVNLEGANLTGIDFNSVHLGGAELSNAFLSSSELNGVILTEANLSGARLIHAVVHHGILKKANLYNANLDGATFNNADLTGAVLTGARISGIGTESWKINSIHCDFVYKDYDGKQREPTTGNFDQGEFEKLYKYVHKINHVFIDEFTYIDILIMDKVVNEINTQNKDYDLKLDCFHARGKPRAEFVIKNKKNADKILSVIKKMHEEEKREFTLKLERAGGEIHAYKGLLIEALKSPKFMIEHYQVNDYTKIWNDSWRNSYGNQPELLKELSQLRNELKRKSETLEQDQSVGSIADAEKAAKDGDGAAAIRHLKHAGKWVLDVSTGLGTNIATELIKKSMGL